MDRYSIEETMRELDENVDIHNDFQLRCMLARWWHFNRGQEAAEDLVEDDDC
jgi:hypothetical protein